MPRSCFPRLPRLPDAISHDPTGRALLLVSCALERWWRRGEDARGGWTQRIERYGAWRAGAPMDALLDIAQGMVPDGSIGNVDELVDLDAPLRALLTDAAALPEPPEALAWLRRAADGAGARGGHDTPREVAARLVASMHEVMEGAPWQGPVLEPAVGGGALLRAWLEAARRHEGSPCPVDLASTLYGVDLDPLAVAATRLTLLDVCFPQLEPDAPTLTQIALADPLAGDGALPPGWPPRFAAMLANPPWASASGRHAVPWARAALRRGGPPRSGSPRGWPGLHTAFAEAILGRLDPGGVAGLILPAQIADLDGYGPFRCRLVERVRRVERLGEGIFPGVTSPVALVVVGPPGERPVILREGAARPRELPRATLRAAPSAAWRVRAARQGSPWPAGFRAQPGAFRDIGVHTGNAARRLIHDAPGPGRVPVLEGGDLLPYGHLTPVRFLRVDHLPDPGERFRLSTCAPARARILMRQTASRPVACLGEGLRFRNSVLASPGIDGLPDEIALAILNSEVGAIVHRGIAPEATQRTFPQVKIAHTARFPWPEPERARGLTGDVIRLVEVLVATMAAWRDDLEASLNEVSVMVPMSPRQRRRWGALVSGRLPRAAGIPSDALARLEDRRRVAREEVAARRAELERIISRLYEPVVRALG